MNPCVVADMAAPFVLPGPFSKATFLRDQVEKNTQNQ